MNDYEELVDIVRQLRDWREDTNDKRKILAIQRVIEKKVPRVIPSEPYHVIGDFFPSYHNRTRDEFMYMHGLRLEDYGANFLSVALRCIGR